MKINQLKKLLHDFSENLHFEYDLKKKIGLILVVNPKYFLKQII